MKYKIVREGGDWEMLTDENGQILAQSHYLDVEEVLEGLGLSFEVEETYPEKEYTWKDVKEERLKNED